MKNYTGSAEGVVELILKVPESHKTLTGGCGDALGGRRRAPMFMDGSDANAESPGRVRG